MKGAAKQELRRLPHVKLAPMSAAGLAGKRQEHLVTVISFAGAGQRRSLFRVLDILTVVLATGEFPEDCRFLLNTQLMFLKKPKDSSAKIFDDDEWLRSLTEAQEIIADIPEECVTYDQEGVDLPKTCPKNSCGTTFRGVS